MVLDVFSLSHSLARMSDDSFHFLSVSESVKVVADDKWSAVIFSISFSCFIFQPQGTKGAGTCLKWDNSYYMKQAENGELSLREVNLF